MDRFVSYLNQYIGIEWEIVLKREKLLKHYQKWNLLDDYWYDNFFSLYAIYTADSRTGSEFTNNSIVYINYLFYL